MSTHINIENLDVDVYNTIVVQVGGCHEPVSSLFGLFNLLPELKRNRRNSDRIRRE